MNILIWLPETTIDLLEISTYIIRDSIFYAQKTAKTIELKVKTLESFPYMGRMVPEIFNFILIIYQKKTWLKYQKDDCYALNNIGNLGLL